MKRANNLLERIADPENLRQAFWKARKGKSYSQRVIKYATDLDNNLLVLREQILSGMVEVGDYHYFTIHDPKKRQICAAAFREQVLHHAIMNVCHEYFDRKQIFDSYASRPGKGIHASLKRVQKFCRKGKWFLKLDVRNFFASIHHETLKEQLQRLFKEHELLNIFSKIINSYEKAPNRGVPIGNLSSQYYANHYLSELDHFIKERLGCKGYIRYMDDMVLLHDSKKWLKGACRHITDFVETKLHCKLKPEQLNSTGGGLPFLGHIVFPHKMRLSQRSKKRYARKILAVHQHYLAERWTEADCRRRVESITAFTLLSDAQALRKDILTNKGLLS